MATTPKGAFDRLCVLYNDAHKTHIQTDQLDPEIVLKWASKPHIEKWAEFQVRYHGWSWFACEAVVRACRTYGPRAQRHIEEQAAQ